MELKHSWTIICEGKSDKVFLERLIRERGLPDFDIVDGEGRGSFSDRLKSIRVATKAKGLEAILIISDNDNDPITSFLEVQEQIRLARDYPIPTEPMQIAKTDGQPTILVMMLPWTNTPGCLETCLRTVWENQDASMKKCVDSFLQCTRACEWEIQTCDKAAIQCYIAGSNYEDPCKSLQYFLKIHDLPMLPMDAPELNNIADALKNFDTMLAT